MKVTVGRAVGCLLRACLGVADPGDPLIDTLIKSARAVTVEGCEKFDAEIQRKGTRRRIARMQASLGDDVARPHREERLHRVS